MATIKKPQVVQDAERLVQDKLAAYESAQKAVDAAKAELDQARKELSAVHRAEDDKLPRCKMVNIAWRSGKPRDAGQDLVIVRKTPTGVLVARRHGEPDGVEFKFKWSEHSHLYRQAEKPVTTMGDTRELREVPQEFLPAVASSHEDDDQN